MQRGKGPEGRMCTDPWAVVMAYVLLEGWGGNVQKTGTRSSRRETGVGTATC